MNVHGLCSRSTLVLLQTRDAVFEQLEKLFVYASMRKDEDTTNSTYQGMYDQAMQLYVRATTAISFIEPEILALPQEKLDPMTALSVVLRGEERP